MDSEEIKALVASLVAKEVGAAKASIRTDNDALNKALTEASEKVERLEGRVGALENPVVKGNAMRLARRWRVIFFVGGALCPAMGAQAIMDKSETLAWAAAGFLVFSSTCLITVGLSNVRDVGNRCFEKALVIMCGLLMAGESVRGGKDEGLRERRSNELRMGFYGISTPVFGASVRSIADASSAAVSNAENTSALNTLVAASCFLPGYAFAGAEDEGTAIIGNLLMGAGVFFSIVNPAAGYKGASMWSALEDQVR